jgi:hypothetical protein
MLSSVLKASGGRPAPSSVEAEEIGLPVRASGLVLPCGCSARVSWT